MAPTLGPRSPLSILPREHPTRSGHGPNELVELACRQSDLALLRTLARGLHESGKRPLRDAHDVNVGDGVNPPVPLLRPSLELR